MLQIQKFGITLLVKKLGSIGESKFFFKHTNIMTKARVDIAEDDMLMNYTHLADMAMNGEWPWCDRF